MSSQWYGQHGAQPPNAGQIPVVTSILKDFSAEALGELRTWLEQNPPAISISSLIGYSRDSMSVRLTRSTDSASLSGGVRTVVTWAVARWNTGGMWDAGTPTQVTITEAGKYLAWSALEFTGTGSDQYEIWKNGTGSGTRQVGTSVAGAQITTVLDLAVGDYIEVYVIAGGSGNVIHKEADTTPEFAVTRISP